MKSSAHSLHRPGLPALLVLLLTLLVCGSAQAVIKGENDPRSYRALTLGNGMKVVLVSDPATDMAAASLSVDVGSGADPRDRAGLAHFLEHMLFLGTDRYPQPGEYKDFIARHGGGDNAYTAFDETNYFFDIEAGHLEPALDRFARFFVAPLFNPEYVQRERQVVQSEYLGRRDDDSRRVYSAAQQAMNPEHPYSTFAVGNLETLADRPGSDVRAELLDFYRRWYSANLMALAVVGREPLDELERWVRSRFEAVENRDARPLAIDVPLFRADTLPAQVDVRPERENFAVSFSFPVPAVREHWRAKPATHLAHLLGHEGESSLLAELKRRGWAQGLSAGTGFDHDSGATIDVNIRLTPEGAARTDAITALLFAYVDVIRRDGLERWLYDENARLAEIDFRFGEKPSPVALARRLASMQHEVPQAEVLRAPYAFDEWRPDLLRDLLSALRPDNVLITRVAPDAITDRTSPWYETPYRITPVSPQRQAAWREPGNAAALGIPQPNPFIPSDLAMLPPGEGSVPVEQVSEPGLRLWHLQDGSFGLPKADFFFAVRSPIANNTPRHSVLTQLYVDVVNDQLEAFAYPADLAGLSFRLYTHMRGFSVRISGYDERQPVLLERILDALAKPRIDPARFEILKAERKRGYENSRRNQPYSRAMTRLRDLLLQPNWTLAEQLSVIDHLSVDQLERFMKRMLGRLEVVALAHGNLDATGAQRLGAMVHEALVAPATVVKVPRGRVMRLRRGDRLASELAAEHPESALVLYLQAPDASLVSRSRAGLMAQVLGSPFFDVLRTEKKLGYVVFANAYPILDSAGVVFILQSPVAGAAVLQAEVRAFLDAYAARLDELDVAEFEQHKRALVARVLEEERQLSERSGRFWEEIDRGNFAFDTRERLAQAVRGVTLEDFKGFYQRVAASQQRRQLAVRAEGTSAPGAGEPPRGERAVTPVWARNNRGYVLMPG